MMMRRRGRRGGREEDEGDGMCRNKNKNPTTQCGEKFSKKNLGEDIKAESFGPSKRKERMLDFSKKTGFKRRNGFTEDPTLVYRRAEISVSVMWSKPQGAW